MASSTDCNKRVDNGGQPTIVELAMPVVRVAIWIFALAACDSPRVAAPPHIATPRAAPPASPCAHLSLASFGAGSMLFVGKLAGRSIDIAIDTGANHASVSPEMAKSLPKLAGAHTESTSAFRKPTTSEVVSVSGLALGAHAFAAFEAAVGADDSPDVTIGVPQLEGLRATFDLHGGTVCIDPGGPLADGESLIRVAHGLLAVPVTSNGRDQGQWLLDTGAGITVVAPALLPALPHRDGQALDVADGNGVSGTQPTVEIDQLCVGRVCKSAQHALVMDLRGIVSDTAGIGVVGLTFLRDSRLVIDLASNRWRLQ